MGELRGGDVVLLLAECNQALKSEWGRVCDFWFPEEPPALVALGALGSALIASVDGASDEQLARISLIVEQALAGGTEEAKDAAATGFLEAVVSAADKRPAAVRFLRMLGPLAKEYIRAWDGFCGVRTAGVWDEL